MKILLVLQAVLGLFFYVCLFLIGYFYGVKLALLIFFALISYQGYLLAKDKYKELEKLERS